MASACVTLSPDQIFANAIAAGFPCATAAQMVAIALKESGGNTCAHNATPPDDSYGLWQINMCAYPNCLGAQNLLPARLAQFGLTAPSQLFDPAVNAAAAYQLWGGNDANLGIAWAINDGGLNQARYLAKLPVGQAAAAAAGCGGPGVDPSISASAADGSSDSGSVLDLSSLGLPSVDLSSLTSGLPGWAPYAALGLLAVWALT